MYTTYVCQELDSICSRGIGKAIGGTEEGLGGDGGDEGVVEDESGEDDEEGMDLSSPCRSSVSVATSASKSDAGSTTSSSARRSSVSVKRSRPSSTSTPSGPSPSRVIADSLAVYFKAEAAKSAAAQEDSADVAAKRRRADELHEMQVQQARVSTIRDLTQAIVAASALGGAGEEVVKSLQAKLMSEAAKLGQ